MEGAAQDGGRRGQASIGGFEKTANTPSLRVRSGSPQAGRTNDAARDVV